MFNKKIEKITIDIIESYGIDAPPISVEVIATKMGLDVRPYDLGQNVSGVLVMDSGRGTIGFNPHESKVRQRFTIAHEIGHFQLHKEDSAVFIDKDFKILFRDENSSTGDIKREQEANAFAAALLMPASLLLKEIKNHNFDLADEDSLKELAKLFNVSIPAMTYRIANLNFFYRS